MVKKLLEGNFIWVASEFLFNQRQPMQMLLGGWRENFPKKEAQEKIGCKIECEASQRTNERTNERKFIKTSQPKPVTEPNCYN